MLVLSWLLPRRAISPAVYGLRVDVTGLVHIPKSLAEADRSAEMRNGSLRVVTGPPANGVPHAENRAGCPIALRRARAPAHAGNPQTDSEEIIYVQATHDRSGHCRHQHY